MYDFMLRLGAFVEAHRLRGVRVAWSVWHRDLGWRQRMDQQAQERSKLLMARFSAGLERLVGFWSRSDAAFFGLGYAMQIWVLVALSARALPSPPKSPGMQTQQLLKLRQCALEASASRAVLCWKIRTTQAFTVHLQQQLSLGHIECGFHILRVVTRVPRCSHYLLASFHTWRSALLLRAASGCTAELRFRSLPSGHIAAACTLLPSEQPAPALPAPVAVVSQTASESAVRYEERMRIRMQHLYTRVMMREMDLRRHSRGLPGKVLHSKLRDERSCSPKPAAAPEYLTPKPSASAPRFTHLRRPMSEGAARSRSRQSQVLLQVEPMLETHPVLPESDPELEMQVAGSTLSSQAEAWSAQA